MNVFEEDELQADMVIAFLQLPLDMVPIYERANAEKRLYGIDFVDG